MALKEGVVVKRGRQYGFTSVPPASVIPYDENDTVKEKIDSMDSNIAGKQNTLTFDSVPTDGSTNPVESNGVYDALAGKQDVFTSGDYLEMSNGVLNVTKNKGNDLYSYKFITTSTSDWPRVKIQRYINGVFQSEETYNNDDVRTNPVTLDGLFTFTYGVDGYRWQYTLLANSHQHNVGEVVKWMYNVSVDNTESFDVVPQDTSKNLVLQEDLDAAISSAYHHAGTKTCAELVAGLLVAGNEGNVYNVTDSGTTTADFIEGAGQPIKAGDNVGIAKISDGVYKFDLLSGFVDTTNFVQKSETAGLLKNDGTVDTNIQGDVDSLKSGLTNLDNEVNGDAVEYPYADVITIPDAVPANVADCKVKIEPVQDLHGYDHPWVGGAGKNKQILTVDEIISGNGGQSAWSNNTRTINDVVYTILTDDSNNVIGIKLNGTANANTLFEFPLVDLDGRYTVNGCPTGGGAQSYRLDLRAYDGGVMITDTGSGATSGNIQISARCIIRIESGTVCDNIVFRPMIRLSTETDATFAPYTNICPITGHTEASVQRVGKNLFDKSAAGIVIGKYLNSETGELVNSTNNWNTSDYIYVGGLSGESITFSGLNSIGTSNFSVCYYDKNNSFISGSNGKVMTLAIPSDERIAYLRFDYRQVDADDVQLELDSTATPYEPYQGKTYTIALGDTIYGGTVDFDSGNLLITHYNYVINGSVGEFNSTNNRYIIRTNVVNIPHAIDAFDTLNCVCDKFETITNRQGATQDCKGVYASGTIIAICGFKNSKSDYETWLASNPLQVCYKLATLFTVQLTPQQIQLLKGQNTLTASTGQISVTVNGVSEAIGQVQEQVNDTDEALAELVADIAEKLPTAPTTDGAYVLTVTVADGTPTYSWESAT